MRKLKIFCPLVLLFSLFTFLFSCNLTSSLPEGDLQEKMEENVRWTNAAVLSVTVAVPSGWGTSPHLGMNKCYDNARAGETPRQGYPFNVEFVPASGFGFQRWLAFKTEDYAKLITGDDDEVALPVLNGYGVEITESVSQTGARIAAVTINITDPVTLVPWCNSKPAVVQTNPPLINTGATYGRGQEIRIWFSMDIDVDTIGFGSGKIELRAQEILADGSIEIYEDVERHFKDPVYQDRRISIATKEDRPPADLIITVSVGTKIAGANGNNLAAPVEFFYRTDNRVIRNVYYADNIWAVHKPDDADDGADFFYQGAANDRDRRLRKTNGEYKVTLYFTVSPSSADIEPTPNAYDIVFIEYSNLAGDDPNNVVAPNMKKTVTSIAAATDPAAAIYRSASQAGAATVYRADYTLNQGYVKPGIIRLAVLPHRTGAAGAAVEPDDWQNAVAEMRFVSVVLDNQPPGGNASFTLSGQVPGSAGNYNDSSNRMLAITPNLAGVADNEGAGIRQMSTTLNRPWTMDEQSVLEWRYSIEKLADDAPQRTTDYESAWFAFGENPPDLDLTGIQFKSANSARKVKAQFRDTLGNESPWFEMAAITYYTPDFEAVTVYSASYRDETYEEEAERNTIAVTWTRPAGMDGVEVKINDGTPINVAGAGNISQPQPGQTRSILQVPRIDAAGVRSGRAVSNVTGYTITLTAYNDYVRADPVTFKIWNIPDMSVSNINPVVELTQENITSLLGAAGSSGKNFVLTSDITLGSPPTAWQPVGTSGTPFQGKFYGNGHTITINGMNPVADMGLFGYVSGSSTNTAEIRDLRVEYNMTATRTGNLNFGGIVGLATGSAKIQNVVVGGNRGTLTLTIAGTTTATPCVGTIIGQMGSGVTIDNGYTAQALTVSGGADQVDMGGMVGDCAGTVNNAISEANVTFNGSCNVSIGGVFGYVHGNTITNCEYLDGEVIANKTGGQTNIGGFSGYAASITKIENSGSRGLVKINYNTGLGLILAGGFSGLISGGVKGSYSNTSLEVTVNAEGSGQRQSIGGFGGRMTGGTTSQCYATGSITVSSTGNETNDYFVGGFTGPIENGITFNDCYATGNVVLERSNSGGGGNSDAGGFGARMETATTAAPNTVNRCFSTGSVTVNTQRIGGGSMGGLVAYIMSANNTISNCVALGSSVTAISTANSGYGRISANDDYGSRSNNHGLNTMAIRYKVGNGNLTLTTQTSSATGKDGQDIQRQLLSSTFWRSVLVGYPVTPVPVTVDEVWDLGTPVTRNGYPTLRGVGGQQ